MAASSHVSQHPEAIQDFHKWRQSPQARLPGCGGPKFETICHFIPRSNLEKYLEKPRLENILTAVLSSNERHMVDANYIRNHYLQTFATLLCIREGSMIHHFQQHRSLRDEKLPYGNQPDDFPFSTPDTFKRFKDEQSQFCAPKFDYNMDDRFKEEVILPILRKDKIGEGGNSVAYKMVVEEEYNSLRPPSRVLPERGRPHKNSFVLKTYREAEAEENYKVERDAYMRLRWSGDPIDHVLAYYGGFVHGNTYNIILEYADQGTLEDYMSNIGPPSTIEELVLLWDRLLHVTTGIMAIHGIGPHGPKISGMHQDIKPANILVFRGNGISPYDCEFKVGDLGLTHFKPNDSQSSDFSGLDAFGTRAYGAPETSRPYAETEACPLRVTPAVDIWSLGCVFSEVAVWAQHGWKKVLEYRRQRSMEIRDKVGREGEYIFHHDGNLLDVVNNIHDDISNREAVKDRVTRNVLSCVVDMLLPEVSARPAAPVVFHKLKRTIDDYRRQFGVSGAALLVNATGEFTDLNDARFRRRTTSSSLDTQHYSQQQRYLSQQTPPPPDDDFTPPSTPSESQSSPHAHGHKLASQNSTHQSAGAVGASQSGGEGAHILADLPTPPPATLNNHQRRRQPYVQQRGEEQIRPTLSVDEGLAWKEKKKAGENIVLNGDENLTSLNQRDHIFLIDNSETMKQFSQDVVKVVSLLAYMVKKSDKDGLDIFFTQSTQKVNSKRSSKLSSSIAQVPFKGKSDMRGRLNTLLQEHISKFGTEIQPPRSSSGRKPPPEPQRPLSFYILTDAKWQPNDVGRLIKDLVGSMIDKNRPKEHIAIQFIRFGDDIASINLLDELDHGLGLNARGMYVGLVPAFTVSADKLYVHNRDIVDHTSWKGNVWKMLLGALNDWYDNDPT